MKMVRGPDSNRPADIRANFGKRPIRLFLPRVFFFFEKVPVFPGCHPLSVSGIRARLVEGEKTSRAEIALLPNKILWPYPY